ncbi:MAG: hypothetical protein H9Q65_04880 [Spiroplasma ixodetis]|nr:hypothetical protein [Spiroplasma ixodetis]MBP1528558.1 hypothetical protein [Spiroplasma ixodetis]
MQLTNENDKMKMIDIAINSINEFIKSFFNELKSNINLVDNDIGKNVLNINGSWGSGKSTIVNNLEFYYLEWQHFLGLFFGRHLFLIFDRS